LTFTVVIEREQAEKINNFDEKSRRIIRTKPANPGENPFPGERGDKEKFCLKDGYVLERLHIGRTRAAFYRVDESEKRVKILEVLPIEQAHKKYGRFRPPA
jgi:mRNA-degrading endonuclease RelE of RelBE toxin-antitoxin system